MGNFVSNFIRSLGLCSDLDCRILMLGLDAAGKTTILYKLKLSEVVSTIPTIGFNVESVSFKNITFQVWDIGGQSKIRPLWKHYFIGARAVIYVVDSLDAERMDEARFALADMMQEEELRGCSLLVLANKQDLPGALSATEISNRLHLHELKTRSWHVQSTSAVTGDGLAAGLDWLAKDIRKSVK